MNEHFEKSQLSEAQLEELRARGFTVLYAELISRGCQLGNVYLNPIGELTARIFDHQTSTLLDFAGKDATDALCKCLATIWDRA